MSNNLMDASKVFSVVEIRIVLLNDTESCLRIKLYMIRKNADMEKQEPFDLKFYANAFLWIENESRSYKSSNEH